MLDYEWGSTNPPPIILSGEESEPAFNPELTHSHGHLPTFIDHHHHHNTFLSPPPQTPPSTAAYSPQFGGFYDDHCTSYSYTMGLPSHDHYESMGGGGGGGELWRSMGARSSGARIGLNLGAGRTYLSREEEEEEFVKRVYRRTRTGGGGREPGSGNYWGAVRCQAEGCNADLSQAKHYHRRHKVCEFHSKASTVITAGFTQRFCQQCSRFHVLTEFDNGKRSCRKRLADHNRRRRKTQQSNQGSPKSKPLETTTSSTDSAARSGMESTGQSQWSVTVAVSPAIGPS